MTEQDKLTAALTQSLKTVFENNPEALSGIADRMFDRYKKFLQWFVGILVVVLIAVFGAYGAMIDSNSKGINSNHEDVQELQTDIGIIDGACSSINPNQAAFGNAFDKYIKRRGAIVK